MTSAARDLRGGEWGFRLEDDGSLSEISYRGERLLVGIQYRVRAAHSWDSIPAELTTQVMPAPGSVRVQVDAVHPIGDALYRRTTTATAHGDALIVETTGSADAGFICNRLGPVLLHPLSLAGSPVGIAHPDGTEEPTRFPVEVSPHQPFLDIAALAYRTPLGTPVRIETEGDVFETEDQRNWSDASFKTYSRPLALPFPYRIEAHDVIRHAIEVRVDPRAARGAAAAADAATHSPREANRPALGVAMGPDDDPDIVAAIARDLGLDHVRADVVAAPDGMRGLDGLAALAVRGLPLDVVLHLGAGGEGRLPELARVLRAARVTALTVFDTDAPATTERAWSAARDDLRDACAGAPMLVGSDDNLAELNRHRPDPAWDADGVSFGVTPQVHDQHESAVLDTVEALPAMVATARSLGRAVAVGALTLRPRRNIYRGVPIDRLGRDSGAVDPRQGTPWAAGYLRGALLTLAAAGVSRVTAFEFTGPRGIVAGDGRLLPVGEVLADLASRETWPRS